MLRLCSKSRKKASEHKLEEERRRAKLRHLAFLAPGALGRSVEIIPSNSNGR